MIQQIILGLIHVSLKTMFRFILTSLKHVRRQRCHVCDVPSRVWRIQESLWISLSVTLPLQNTSPQVGVRTPRLQHGGSPSRCDLIVPGLKCRPLNYLSFRSDHPIYLGLLQWIYCLVSFQAQNVKSKVMCAVALLGKTSADPSKAGSSWSLDRAWNK